MKKVLSFALTLVFCAGAFCAGIDVVSAHSEMMTAYNSGFYPGVVRYADEILNEAGTSAFAGKAMVYKGESLFRIGRVKDSLYVLEKAEGFVRESKTLSAQRCYWMGRGFSSVERSDAAVLYYHKAAELSGGPDKADFPGSLYAASIYWSGKACFELKDYTSASLCFEYVSENGKYYSQRDYEDSLVLLAQSLVLSGQNQKAVDLGNKAEALAGKQSLSEECIYSVMLYGADGLIACQKYPEAYRQYCKVLSDGPSVLAAIAMEKAYSVSSKYQSQVKEEPGNIILKAQSRLEAYPQLVSEFWTRLAVDAFNAKNYEKSSDYFKSAEKDSTADLKKINCLYTTEIGFITSKKSINLAAAQALQTIKDGEKNLDVKKGDRYEADFAAAKARYAGLSENWEESLVSARQAADAGGSAEKTATYWEALSLYNMKKYPEALKLLEEKNYSEDDFALLKAKTLARCGRSSEADKIFYSLGQKGSLNNDGRLDYTRTLLNAGHLISTVEQASVATGAEADYMKGLALFNRRKWADAEAAFARISGNQLEAKYVNFSRFYTGYCQYQLGKFSQAYTNLSTFISMEGTNALVWDAAVTASRAAVQSGKTTEAIQMAQKAQSASKNESQKQESVLLTAGIYSDAGRYDDAIKVLKPYSQGRTEFALQCKYLTAQILVQKKEYAQADAIYGQLSQEKSVPALAEEAAYRRGELSYTTEDWQKAMEKFDAYSKQYFGGQFFTAAQYFTADCCVKTNRPQKAIMYYEEIVNSRENSTYRYGAEKQLVELYKAQGDYSAALAMAKKMIEDYGEQASRDGMTQTVKELRALNAGADKTLLKKESEYENAGGLSTVQGRRAGTELAQIYGQSQDSWAKAQTLAQSLLKEQTKTENSGESLYAAQNYVLLASINRSQSKLDKAADNFLNAAKYYRLAGKDDDAAKALYGAAEAFDAAGRSGDARSTAETLKQLYPSSSYASEAEKLGK